MPRGEPGLRRGAGHSGNYAFAWNGPPYRISSDLIEIDNKKTYELKGFFKADRPAISSGDLSGEALAKTDALPAVVFGVLMYDAQKRHIKRWNVLPDKRTMTVLTAACESGNKTLKVKEASAWKTGPLFVVAFGQKENEPNFDVSPLGIAEIKPEGDHWRIVLNEPCGLAFPTGTPVVENRAASHGIFLSGAITNEWTEIKGTIGPKQWWPGTKYVSIYILPQRAGNTGTLLIDDLLLTLLKAAG